MFQTQFCLADGTTSSPAPPEGSVGAAPPFKRGGAAGRQPIGEAEGREGANRGAGVARGVARGVSPPGGCRPLVAVGGAGRLEAAVGGVPRPPC